MNKDDVVKKLNAISVILHKCVQESKGTTDYELVQDIALAAITHELLYQLLLKEGPSANVISMIEEFGPATADLYFTVQEVMGVTTAPITTVDPSTLN